VDNSGYIEIKIAGTKGHLKINIVLIIKYIISIIMKDIYGTNDYAPELIK